MLIKKIKRNVRPNQVEMDYETMKFKQIEDLPIKDISDSNSVLFLWTIQKYLPSSFGLLEKWGFKYLFIRTCFFFF